MPQASVVVQTYEHRSEHRPRLSVPILEGAEVIRAVSGDGLLGT